jgi:hypothetical protein
MGTCLSAKASPSNGRVYLLKIGCLVANVVTLSVSSRYPATALHATVFIAATNVSNKIYGEVMKHILCALNFSVRVTVFAIIKRARILTLCVHFLT